MIKVCHKKRKNCKQIRLSKWVVLGNAVLPMLFGKVSTKASVVKTWRWEGTYDDIKENPKCDVIVVHLSRVCVLRIHERFSCLEK